MPKAAWYSCWPWRRRCHFPGLVVGIWVMLIALFGAKKVEGGTYWLPSSSPLSSAIPSEVTGVTSPSSPGVATWSPRSGGKAIAFQGTIWMIGGGNGGVAGNEVWIATSTAGWSKHATSGAFSARSEFALTVVGAAVFMTGGLHSSSTPTAETWKLDGSTFSLLSISLTFPARSSHASAALGSKLVVLCGADSSNNALNDVWLLDSSAVASGWSQLSAAATWPGPRFSTAAVAHLGNVWLIGGKRSETVAYKDVWLLNATDSSLTRTFDPAFLERYGHSLVSLPSSLMLLGGTIASTGRKTNEVWSLSDSTGTWSQGTNGAWTPRSSIAATEVPWIQGIDPAGAAVMIMGGQADTTSMNDVWTLSTLLPPSPPARVTAEAVQSPNIVLPSNTVVLRWSLPADTSVTGTGGAAIQGWAIGNSLDGAPSSTSSVKVNASAAIAYEAGNPSFDASLIYATLVTGLTADFSYSFSLAAYNYAGYGSASTSSNTVTTASAGRLVNNGGAASVNPTVITATGDGSVTASGGGAVTREVWFIILMLLVGIGVFVTICVAFIRMYTKRASRELAELERIEGMDDIEAVGEPEEDPEASPVEPADHEDQSSDNLRERGAVEGIRLRMGPPTEPSPPPVAGETITLSSLVASTPTVAQLQALGLKGIAVPLSRAEALEAWRAGQLSKDKRGSAGKFKRYASVAAALATKSAGADKSVSPDQRLAAALLAPLGVEMGSPDEERAIDQLAQRMALILQEEDEALRAQEASDQSKQPLASPPTSASAVCKQETSLLLSSLSSYYSSLLSSFPVEDLHSVPRMLPERELQETLMHAYYSSRVLECAVGSSPAQLRFRSQIRHLLFGLLLPEVEVEAVAAHAKNEASGLLAAASTDTNGKGTEGRGGGEEHERGTRTLFLIARAAAMQFLYRRVRDHQQRRPKIRNTPSIPSTVLAPSESAASSGDADRDMRASPTARKRLPPIPIPTGAGSAAFMSAAEAALRDGESAEASLLVPARAPSGGEPPRRSGPAGRANKAAGGTDAERDFASVNV